jgi:hypothetical protein
MIRFLILLHRYLGIALAVVFVIWFASGFAIIYTGGMPALSQADRLNHLPDLNLEQLVITPFQAQQIAGVDSIPKLTSIMNRTAYQFPGRRSQVVFAEDGVLLNNSMISSRQIVSEFTDAADNLIERIGTVEEVDQWTLTLRAELPLEKFSVNDGQGTEVYVSQRKGQVVLFTTSRDRLLAWLGAIPHWLYFVDLRKNAALWNDVVVWLASLGSILALIGVLLTFTQLRKTQPFSIVRAIPYKGIMRWHYLTGLCFGLVTLTWVFSGLLSMDPYSWNRSGGLLVDRSLLNGGDIGLSEFSNLTEESNLQLLASTLQDRKIKEIEFRRLQGDYFFEITVLDSSSSWGFSNQLISLENFQLHLNQFSSQYIVEQFADSFPAHNIVATDNINDYDNYYYSRESSRTASAPLPVLRLKFDDPMSTWFYVALNSNEIVSQSNRLRRIERWLYNGLHSLDFRIWYQIRPLWDIVVLFLLSGGLLLVSIGVYIGVRRLYLSIRSH